MDEQLEVTLKGGEYKRLLEKQFANIKEKYGLKKVEIEVLFFLTRCQEENTPTDIYHHLKLNRGHVSQAIDSLNKFGYITATPDKNDRRFMHYAVTDKAREVIEEIAEIHKKMDECILSGISEEEIKLFKSVIAKIRKNMKKLL